MGNILKIDELKKYRTNEYGMPLFHDIDYNPVFKYKPFSPYKCTKTYKEHYQIIKYMSMEYCSQCLSRRRGERTDDICCC